jgi:hypothetical protein
MSKAGRSQIDVHPQRARIELEIAMGKSLRRIARKFHVHVDAVWRHKRKLPPQLKAALAGHTLRPGIDLEKLGIEESEGLLQNLAYQRAKLLLVQDLAVENHEPGIVAQLSAQIHRNLQLVGQFLGAFAEHQLTANISILIQPEYLRLRQVLVQSLQPFPDAKRTVATALHKLEAEMAPPLQIEGKAKPWHQEPGARDGVVLSPTRTRLTAAARSTGVAP